MSSGPNESRFQEGGLASFKVQVALGSLPADEMKSHEMANGKRHEQLSRGKITTHKYDEAKGVMPS